jgi:hypothetical protein
MSVNANKISVNNNTNRNAISNQNFFFGVDGGDDYGPSNQTNFFNGVPVPPGGYVIYVYQNSQITAHAPKDDNECLYYLNRYGANATNITDALNWATTQNFLIVRSSEYTLYDLPSVGQATTGHTMLLTTQVDGSSNWHYVILDFTNNLITTPYDMGININDYSASDIYYTNNRGYMVTAHNQNYYYDMKFYFISANGVLVDTYSATAPNSNYAYGNYVTYVVDNTNGIFKYFDGLHVYTRDISGYNTTFGVPYYYDDCGGIDAGILTTWNDGPLEHVEYNYQGNVITLNIHNLSSYNMDYFNYNMTNFTVLVTKHTNTGLYYRVDLHENLTGNLLHRIPVDDYSYDYYDIYFYGNGKVLLLLRNTGDTSIPYRMINYDGVINRLISVDQANDGNYNNNNIYTTTDYPNTNYGNPSESIFIKFYDDGSSYNNFMNTYGYHKTYSFYDGCESPSVFILNDTGVYDKAICNYGEAISNHFYSIISTNLTTVQFLILGEPTETIIETNITLCDNSNDGMNDFNVNTIGDNLYIETFSGNSVNYNDFKSFVVGKISGTTYNIRAQKVFSTTNHTRYRGNGFITIVDFDNNQSWYFNNSVNDFTEINYLSSISYSTADGIYNPPNFERRSAYVFYSYDNFEAYIINKNTITSVVQLQLNNGYSNIQMGTNGFIYVYNRRYDGTIIIDFYDLSLNRTQRIITNELVASSVNVDGDRYYVLTYDTNTNRNIHYEITQTSYHTISLPGNTFGPVPNDYVYGY